MRKHLKATIARVRQIRHDRRARRVEFHQHYLRVFRELAETTLRSLRRRRYGDRQ